jgi:hypothetical protein
MGWNKKTREPHCRNAAKSNNIGTYGRMFLSDFLHMLHVELNVVPFNVDVQLGLDFKLILGI